MKGPRYTCIKQQCTKLASPSKANTNLNSHHREGQRYAPKCISIDTRIVSWAQRGNSSSYMLIMFGCRCRIQVTGILWLACYPLSMSQRIHRSKKAFTKPLYRIISLEYWDMTPCTLVEFYVSEDHSASVFVVEESI